MPLRPRHQRLLLPAVPGGTRALRGFIREWPAHPRAARNGCLPAAFRPRRRSVQLDERVLSGLDHPAGRVACRLVVPTAEPGSPAPETVSRRSDGAKVGAVLLSAPRLARLDVANVGDRQARTIEP